MISEENDCKNSLNNKIEKTTETMKWETDLMDQIEKTQSNIHFNTRMHSETNSKECRAKVRAHRNGENNRLFQQKVLDRSAAKRERIDGRNY